MKILYSCIEISKVLEDFKETRKYYITKEDAFGFEITKANNDELVENEVLSVHNVIDSEEKIRRLIDEVIKCEDDYDQAKYVVEDYIKSQTNYSML